MKSFLKKYYTSLGRYRALYLISAVELCIIICWSIYSGEGLKWWDEVIYFERNYEIAEFTDFVNNQIRKHPKELWSFLINQRLDDIINSDCVYTGDSNLTYISSITQLLRVNNATALLIYVLGLALFISYVIRQRKINLLLSLFFMANYVTIWIGAPSDYARLLAQNYPVLIAISCWVLDRLCGIASSKDYNHIRD